MPHSDHPLLAKISQDLLLLSPTSGELFQRSIAQVLKHERSDDMQAASMALPETAEEYWDQEKWQAAFRPYNVVAGTLIVPVYGALLHKFSFQLGAWATGYDYIYRAVQRGLSDDNVQNIALDVDSPGGQVPGCFELCDSLIDASEEKPLTAYANDNAYSAAYAIAATAGEIVVTRSGGVGSIGVVAAHVSYEGALDAAGVKVNFIFAGKHKVDGNAYQDLSEGVRKRIQERVNKTYTVFAIHVAKNRPMDVKQVRATEALTYDADDAIKVGLADRVGSLEDAMAVGDSPVAPEEDNQMSTTAKNAAAQTADSGITQAAHDAAVATAATEGHAAGMKAGKERVSAILGCDEAVKRPASALSCALQTDMSAEDAIAFLANIPEEKSAEAAKEAAAETPFNAAMANGNPEVGASLDANNDDNAEKTEDDMAADILGSYKVAATH